MPTRRPRRKVSGELCVEIPEDVLVREIDGDLVVLDLRSEKYYGLDEVGARFWAALANHRSVDGARRALLAEFDVQPNRLDRDLKRLLADLRAHGLVKVREG